MVKRITKKRGGASFNGKNTKDLYSLKNDKFFTLDKPSEFKYCCVLGPFGIVYITGKYIEREIDEFKTAKLEIDELNYSSLNGKAVLHVDPATKQILLQYNFIFSNTSKYNVTVVGRFLILKNDEKTPLIREVKFNYGSKKIGMSLNGPTQNNEGLALNDPAPNGPTQNNEGLELSLNDPTPNNEGLLTVKSLNELPEQDRKYFSSSIENSKSSSYYIMINGTKFFIKTHTLDKSGKNKDSVLYETINLFARYKLGESQSVTDMILYKKHNGQLFIYFMKLSENFIERIKGFEVFTVVQPKLSLLNMIQSKLTQRRRS